MKKNLMKKAHEMTRKIVEKYGDVDYKTQLSLCLSFLSQEDKEGGKEITVEETIKEVDRFGKDLPVDVQANEWEKYGHHRIYVNMFWPVKATRGKFREWRKGNVGYFVVQDNEVVEFVVQEKGAQYSSSVSAEIIEKCQSLVA